MPHLASADRHRLPAGALRLARARWPRRGSPAGSGRPTCSRSTIPGGWRSRWASPCARRPFLLLAIAGGPGAGARPAALLAVARSAGYGAGEAWLKLVLPCSTARSACRSTPCSRSRSRSSTWRWCSGPSAPPVLAVQLLRWLTDPDPAWHPVGAAGALLQLGLIAGGARRVAPGRAGGRGALARPWLVARAEPSRRAASGRGRAPAPTAPCSASGLAGLAVVAAVVGGRSLALPGRLAAAACRWRAGRWAAAGPRTCPWPTRSRSASLAALVALVAVLACLEHEARAGARPESRVLWRWPTCPCSLPQVGFLFGLQVLFVRLGLDATLVGLAWSHLVFVLPYTVLMLRGALSRPRPALARRRAAASAARRRAASGGCACRCCAGRSWWRWRSASASAWRSTCRRCSSAPAGCPTLTTEALALALGGDRRLAAVAALLLAALPLLALAAALAVPSPRLGHREPD